MTLFFNFKINKKNTILKYQKYPNNFSLSGQDVLIQATQGENNSEKFYLEIGAGWPIKINNTYALEKYHDWKGISIDFDPKMVAEFNKIRANKCIYADATDLNYSKLLSLNGFPPRVGYLSLDIDPAFQTLKVLTLIPFNEFNFSIITFEHDSYRCGSLIKFSSRLLLMTSGYICVKKNVKAKGFGNYEDWWINPSLIDPTSVRKIISQYF